MGDERQIILYIVEDDKLFSSLMKGLVENLERDFRNRNHNVSIQVSTFAVPHSAEQNLAEHKPDIVLLDYYLTDELGKIVTCDDFLKKVLEANPASKVVIISGQSKRENVKRLKDSGAAFYISKDPRTIHRIIPTLKMIIEKKLNN